MLRGFHNIGDDNFIYSIKNKILKKNINFENEFYFKNISESYNIEYNLLIKPIIYKKLLGKNFNKEILLHFSKQNKYNHFTLPKEFQEVLYSNNILSRKTTNFKWNFFLLKEIIKNLLLFIKLFYNICLNLIFLSKKNNKKKLNNYFLSDLTIKNFYKINNLETEKNIFTSIQKINNLKINFFQENHFTNHKFKNFNILKGYFFGHNSSLKTLSLFSFWFIKNYPKLFFEFFRKKWVFILCFDEFMKAAIIKYQPKENVYNKYLFSNSSSFIRPFYTYELEKKNIDSIFYFYSLNSDSIFNNDRETIFFRYNTWKKYYVWNKYNIEFIEKFKNHVKINYQLTGPIFFEGSNKKKHYTNKSYIAVFDISPIRKINFILSNEQRYFYTPKYCMKFLEDLKVLSDENNKKILIKKKRKYIFDSHNIMSSSLIYENYLNKNFDVIDPEVNAIDVINDPNCEAVISMIFTSTAHIASFYGLKSIYYTPYEIKNINRSALGGIDLLIGKKRLIDFFKF